MDTVNDSWPKRIRQLCQEGYALLDAGKPTAALRLFYQAWTLVPLPQPQHEESGWVLTAIGDAYLAEKRYPLAIEALRSASCCHNNTQNPLIRFKLGQALYENGDTGEAGEALALAWRWGGDKVFAGQPGKYLTLAKLQAR